MASRSERGYQEPPPDQRHLLRHGAFLSGRETDNFPSVFSRAVMVEVGAGLPSQESSFPSVTFPFSTLCSSSSNKLIQGAASGACEGIFIAASLFYQVPVRLKPQLRPYGGFFFRQSFLPCTHPCHGLSLSPQPR